jgi:hypothetical protein
MSDPDAVEKLLDIMMTANPTVQRFVRVPRDEDGRLNRTALTTAITRGFRTVRWHLDPADLPTASWRPAGQQAMMLRKVAPLPPTVSTAPASEYTDRPLQN